MAKSFHTSSRAPALSSQTLDDITIRKHAPHMPFIHRKVSYPCGCKQRSRSIPSLSSTLYVPSATKASNHIWSPPKTLTTGLHIDAEFIFEDSRAPHQWQKDDQGYIAWFGAADHSPTCRLHRKNNLFRGRGAYGSLYRNLPIHNMIIFRCGCHTFSSIDLLNLDTTASLPINRLRIRDREHRYWWLILLRAFRPLELWSGIHIEAEFCWGLVEHERLWCGACAGVIGELAKAVESMCGDWEADPWQMWEGATERSSWAGSYVSDDDWDGEGEEGRWWGGDEGSCSTEGTKFWRRWICAGGHRSNACDYGRSK